MPQPEGERLATVEQVLRDLRIDAADYRQEQQRTRERLHALEATVRGLVLANEGREAETIRRQRALEIRMQVLTVAVLVASVLVPFLTYAAGR